MFYHTTGLNCTSCILFDSGLSSLFQSYVDNLRMGRTKRIRKRKQQEKQIRPIKVDCQQNFVNLCKWMTCEGWHAVSNLCPAVFWNTGRGLMAMSTIPAQSLLVEIPEKLLVTKKKVLQEIPVLQQFNMTTAECLTFFILHSKFKEIYCPFIATLPSNFTVGGLCKSKEVAVLPLALQEKVLSQQKHVMGKYQKFLVIWEKIFSSTLPLDLFQWAWFAVNSRCFYYQDSDELPNPKSENNMALAPYFDMFNHDSTVNVDACFNSVSRCFEVRTNQKFKKYEQVFINYGPHDNQTLFLEYGFIIPNNVFKMVEIDLRHFLDMIPTKKVLPEQLTILSQLSKSANLFVRDDGFSWGAQIALTVLTLDSAQLSMIDSPFEILPSNTPETEALGLKLVTNLKQELLDSLKEADETCYDTSASFSVARSLIHDMISILNRHSLNFSLNDLNND